MCELMLVLEWLLLIVLIGVIAFPLTASFCNLPERGYSISKLVGLLIITYITWLVVSFKLTTFGIAVIVFSLLILIFLSFRKFEVNLFTFKTMKSELVFLISFLVFTVIVMNKPDIYGPHSEDFMDFAFLQSIMRTTYFPPPDPWMAGENLSYYYFGQLVVAILTKLTNIPSNITYNLAIPMFFALTVQAAYGLIYNLTGRTSFGLMAALFVSVTGFMSGFLQLTAYLVPASRSFIRYVPLKSQDIMHWFMEFDFWNSTGIIPETFNFYPFHTFAHGYLHAHMMSIPFQLMLITICLGLYFSGKVAGRDKLLLGLSIGFFAGMNVWEFPTYLLFTGFMLFIVGQKKTNFIQVSALSFILYLPYFLTRDAGGFGGVILVARRTTFLNFIEIFGLFVFAILSFLIVYCFEHRKSITMPQVLTSAAIFLTFVVTGVILNFQLLPLLAVFISIPLYGITMFKEREEKFALLLILVAGLILLLSELFSAIDAMPWTRFNTIMKLHLEVWVFWGAASAYSVYYCIRKSCFNRNIKIIWSLALVFLIAASLIHPVASVTNWTSGKTFFGTDTRGTVDGTAYLKKTNSGDYLAINWINKNIKGMPVILEAPGNAYEYSSQISTMTGLPTVIGWISHERMWNNKWDKIDERINDTDTIYSTADTKKALELLKKYNVHFIYIGNNEIKKYPQVGLLKFGDEEYFELVHVDKTQLYGVKP
jgi:YYY domain-containing protein